MPNIYLYTTERRRESLKVTEEWVEELTAARRKWYKQPDIDKFSYAPGDFEAATFFMTQRYDAIAQEAGLDAKWSTWLPRNEAFIWVAHELRKIKKAKPKEKKSVKKPASSRKRKVAKP
jgi:NADPH-dependent ferric siderophore reductase